VNPTVPIVLHIPHNSRTIPPEIRKSILLVDSALEIELIKMTDAFTCELFVSDSLKACAVVCPISRIVLDPERFLDDDQEIMARCGMGVVYTRTSDGKALRHLPTTEERKTLIDRYYHPHHQKLENSVLVCLEKFKRCMIIDCHSFPSKALPYELDQSEFRPDICIGADSFHTPDWLIDKLSDEFGKSGYSTAVNAPFIGAIVPMAYYRKESAVMSVMIEVNRKLYMDEQTGKGNSGFYTLKRQIAKILEKLPSQANL